jgi:hypothetical protein
MIGKCLLSQKLRLFVYINPVCFDSYCIALQGNP